MELQRAKDTVREYFRRLLNERDLSVCDELLAPDYRDHDAPLDAPAGPETTKVYVAAFLRDYPDLRADVVDVIAEGNRVAARVVWHGTHKDSGQPYRRTGVVMLRLNPAGQLAERWSGYALVQ